jgi:hypothetical protein
MGKKGLKFGSQTSNKKKPRKDDDLDAQGETPEFGNLLRRNIDFKSVDLKDPSKQFNGMMKLGTPKQPLDGYTSMKYQTPKVTPGGVGVQKQKY